MTRHQTRQIELQVLLFRLFATAALRDATGEV
jgi:hypothetical protein